MGINPTGNQLKTSQIKKRNLQQITDAGDTGGESTGPMSTGMIYVQED